MQPAGGGGAHSAAGTSSTIQSATRVYRGALRRASSLVNYVRMSRSERRAWRRRKRAEALFNHRMERQDDLELVGRVWWRRSTADETPADVAFANLTTVVDALERAGVPYFLVRKPVWHRHAVGVLSSARQACLRALAAAEDDRPVYGIIPVRAERRRPFPLVTLVDQPGVASADVVTVCTYVRRSASLVYGRAHGCDVEFWQESDTQLLAPRPNTASDCMPSSVLTSPSALTVGGRQFPTLEPFLIPSVDGVTFPVDAVYTWVDAEDQDWRLTMERYRAQERDLSFHPMAQHVARFRSRDELKYALRSLTLYAPWIRHVYLVTDGQIPEWLDPAAEGITLVHHREIFDDPTKLPVFNSNAIISQLHRISGLSEHYLYINDDVFFGRPVVPSLFFSSGGIARVFPSRRLRPLDDPSIDNAPHINLTTNIRRMIARDFGRSLSNAIKHTPSAHLRSVHEEMALRYADEYEKTSTSRFRHHYDFAADQLFHYYAQVTGRAAPGSIEYQYANVEDANDLNVLEELLEQRHRDVFCLNDAPEEGLEPMPTEVVFDFLKTYFPVRSRFEREVR